MQNVTSQEVKYSLEEDFHQLFTDAANSLSVDRHIEGDILSSHIESGISDAIHLKLNQEIEEARARLQHAASLKQSTALLMENLLELEGGDDPNTTTVDEQKEETPLQAETNALVAAIKRKEDISAMLDHTRVIVEDTDTGFSYRYVIGGLNRIHPIETYEDLRISPLLESLKIKIEQLNTNEKQLLSDYFLLGTLLNLFEATSLNGRFKNLIHKVFTEANIKGHKDPTKLVIATDDIVPVLIGCLPNDRPTLEKLEKTCEKLNSFFYRLGFSGQIAFTLTSISAAITKKLSSMNDPSEEHSQEINQEEIKAALVTLRAQYKKEKEKAEAEDKHPETLDILAEKMYSLASKLYPNDCREFLESFSQLQSLTASQIDKVSLVFFENLLRIHGLCGKKNKNAFSEILLLIGNAQACGKPLTDKSLEDEIANIILKSRGKKAEDNPDWILEIKYILFNMAHNAPIQTIIYEISDQKQESVSPKKEVNPLKELENARKSAYEYCKKQILKPSNLCAVKKEILAWAEAAFAYEDEKEKRDHSLTRLDRLAETAGRFLSKGRIDSLYRQQNLDFLKEIISADGDISKVTVEISKENDDTVAKQFRLLKTLYNTHVKNHERVQALTVVSSHPPQDSALRDEAFSPRDFADAKSDDSKTPPSGTRSIDDSESDFHGEPVSAAEHLATSPQSEEERPLPLPVTQQTSPLHLSEDESSDDSSDESFHESLKEEFERLSKILKGKAEEKRPLPTPPTAQTPSSRVLNDESSEEDSEEDTAAPDALLQEMKIAEPTPEEVPPKALSPVALEEKLEEDEKSDEIEVLLNTELELGWPESLSYKSLPDKISLRELLGNHSSEGHLFKTLFSPPLNELGYSTVIQDAHSALSHQRERSTLETLRDTENPELNALLRMQKRFSNPNPEFFEELKEPKKPQKLQETFKNGNFEIPFIKKPLNAEQLRHLTSVFIAEGKLINEYKTKKMRTKVEAAVKAYKKAALEELLPERELELDNLLKAKTFAELHEHISKIKLDPKNQNQSKLLDALQNEGVLTDLADKGFEYWGQHKHSESSLFGSDTTITTRWHLKGEHAYINFFKFPDESLTEGVPSFNQLFEKSGRRMIPIHWLFPTESPSQYVKNLPELNEEVLLAFQKNPALKSKFIKGFHFMLNFYGFKEAWDGSIVPIVQAPKRFYGIKKENKSAPWSHVHWDSLAESTWPFQTQPETFCGFREEWDGSIVPTEEFPSPTSMHIFKPNYWKNPKDLQTQFMWISRILDSLICFGLKDKAIAFHKALLEANEKAREECKIPEKTLEIWDKILSRTEVAKLPSDEAEAKDNPELSADLHGGEQEPSEFEDAAKGNLKPFADLHGGEQKLSEFEDEDEDKLDEVNLEQDNESLPSTDLILRQPVTLVHLEENKASEEGKRSISLEDLLTDDPESLFRQHKSAEPLIALGYSAKVQRGYTELSTQLKLYKAFNDPLDAPDARQLAHFKNIFEEEGREIAQYAEQIAQYTKEGMSKSVKEAIALYISKNGTPSHERSAQILAMQNAKTFAQLNECILTIKLGFKGFNGRSELLDALQEKEVLDKLKAKGFTSWSPEKGFFGGITWSSPDHDYVKFFKFPDTSPREGVNSFNEVMKGMAPEKEGLAPTAPYGFLMPWLFPTCTPSQNNNNLPKWSNEILGEFERNKALKPRLIQAFNHMLGFLGFEEAWDGSVVPTQEFPKPPGQPIYTTAEHYYLWIARMLESLTLFGFGDKALAFHDALLKVNAEQGRENCQIPVKTRAIWEQKLPRKPEAEPSPAASPTHVKEVNPLWSLAQQAAERARTLQAGRQPLATPAPAAFVESSSRFSFSGKKPPSPTPSAPPAVVQSGEPATAHRPKGPHE